MTEIPTATRPKVAIIGIGVAGLTAAWKLRHTCDLTLFEKNDYIGGHTRTLTIPKGDDEGTPVDTGFIVMNHRNYPHFTQLLQEWDVALEDSDMSFSYHDVLSRYEYAGTGIRGIFPSPRLLAAPAHWKLLTELRRFGIVGTRALADGSASTQTLGQFLDTHRFATVFRDHYLYAMGAAIWSSPPAQLADFPAEPYLHFFQNHGLLTLKNRPQWRIVKGGSQTYVRKVLASLDVTIHTETAPTAIFRGTEKVTLHLSDARKMDFDHVFIGAHADEALKLLGDADPQEIQRLSPWQYQPNAVVLHTWDNVMPRHKSCWASWNFSREDGFDPEKPVSVTYWMNRLQNLKTRHQYFVTLNRVGEIPEAHIINRTVLHHPHFTREAMETQTAIREQNGHRRTWLVGSYQGYGFHEDAVRSAVEATDRFLQQPALRAS